MVNVVGDVKVRLIGCLLCVESFFFLSISYSHSFYLIFIMVLTDKQRMEMLGSILLFPFFHF